ncbi:MAG: hypothetical protein DHS20C20_13670 [Ardenticatenaceae bacterium]|nr:MAG: hypothetical protein DHS20C20_13670 [Ardenticatenaceae bacterium]
MGKRPLRYHSFILTLWQEAEAAPGQPSMWRFRLEDPHTADRWGFTEATELVQFLEVWTTVPSPGESSVET